MLSTATAFSILLSGLCAISVAAAAAATDYESPATLTKSSNFCAQDIKLFKTDGVTAFPTMDDPLKAPVTIVSQDISSVTVELRQQWFPTVDSIHYTFHENHSYEKCYEATSIDEDALFDTITIQCNSKTHLGELSICLSDNEPNGNLLEGDAADFPEHCYQALPGIDHEHDNAKGNNKPTVCYSLRVRCDTLCDKDVARKRGLRGKTY